MAYRTELEGCCHCGNIEIELATDLPVSELPLRGCACRFCRCHGTRCTSDPAGRALIRVNCPELLQRYRFALRTADFLTCRRCGVYVAAVMDLDGDCYATVNVNALDSAEDFGRDPSIADYSGEDEFARRSRRKARWTPVSVELGGCES